TPRASRHCVVLVGHRPRAADRLHHRDPRPRLLVTPPAARLAVSRHEGTCAADGLGRAIPGRRLAAAGGLVARRAPPRRAFLRLARALRSPRPARGGALLRGHATPDAGTHGNRFHGPTRFPATTDRTRA